MKERVQEGVGPARSSAESLAKGLRVRREARVLRKEKREDRRLRGWGGLGRARLEFGGFAAAAAAEEEEEGHVSVAEEEEEDDERESRSSR